MKKHWLILIFLLLFFTNKNSFAENLEEIQSLSITLKEVQKNYNASLENISNIKKKIASLKKEIAGLVAENNALREREITLDEELIEIQHKLSSEKEMFKTFLTSDFFTSEAEARFVALARTFNSPPSEKKHQQLSSSEINIFYQILIERRETLLKSIVDNENKIKSLQIEINELKNEKESKKTLLSEMLEKSSEAKKESETELQGLSDKKLQLTSLQGILKAKQLRLTVALGGIEDIDISSNTKINEVETHSMVSPVEGGIIREFNAPRTRKSVIEPTQGIDFSPTINTIKAALNGKVRYVGQLKGYDSLVIIEHPNRIFTFYAPIDGVKVKSGEKIEAGKVLGSTRKNEIFYFEVRKGQVSENPKDFLASYLKP